jgi:hypothetical protein
MAPMASMRFMLPLSGVLTVLAGIVGFVFRGATGAIGAAAGVMLISGLFVLSTWAITRTDLSNRPMVLPVGMGVYMLKLVVLLVVLSSLSGWAGIKPMALGVVAGALGWAGGYAWWVWHAKLTLEFPEKPDQSRLRRD